MAATLYGRRCPVLAVSEDLFAGLAKSLLGGTVPADTVTYVLSKQEADNANLRNVVKSLEEKVQQAISELEGAQQEVAEFHRFQKLSQDLITLNEKICRLRPVERQRGGSYALARSGISHTAPGCTAMS